MRVAAGSSGAWRSLALLSLCVAAAGAPLGAQTEEDGIATVEAVRLIGRPGGMELQLASTADLGLVGLQRDPDDSLVLQLPRHRPAPSVIDLFPDAGLVAAVRITVQETARGPLTRIVLTLRQPLAYAFRPEGNRLRLELWPRESPPPPSAAELEARRQVRALEESLVQASQRTTELEDRLAEAAADKAAAAQRFAALESRRQALDETLQATLEEVRALAGERSSETAELEDRLRQAAEREAELTDRIAELESTVASSLEEREVLDSQVEAWRAEIDRTTQEREGIDRRLAAAAERTATLERELLAAREARQEAETRAGELAGDQLPALRAERDELAGRLADAQQELARLRQEGFTLGRTLSGANLRQGPSVETEALTLLPAGSPLEIVAQEGDWLRVRSGPTEGWIYADLVQPDSAEVARLEGELQAARQAREELERRLGELRIDREDEAQRIADLEVERDALARDLADARNQNERLRMEGVERGRTTDGANLRQGPGLEHEVATQLPAGAGVEILGREGTWYQVRQGETLGWLFGDLLQPESEEIARLTTALANTETERDQLAARIAQMSRDQDTGSSAVERMSADNDRLRQELAASRAEFERIRREDLTYGLTSAGANLREAPSTESERLGLLPAGASVEILEQRDGWYRVLAGSQPGWVWGELVIRESAEIARLRAELAEAQRELERVRAGTSAEPEADASPAPPTEPAEPTEQAPSAAAADQPAAAPGNARTAARVFLRAGPSTEYDSIALISPDVSVRVEARQGEWYQVTVRGTTGWMYGPLLAWE